VKPVPPDRPRGILLVHGGVDGATTWAERGVAPVAVVPEDGRWTAVLPVAAATAARRPYDDAVTLLLNRPVPHRLRPAIGLGVVGRRAVLCVTPGGWRAVRRWLVWQPGTGVVHPGGLPVARLADVVAAAGVDDPAGDAALVVADVLVTLGLPGGSLVEGATDPGEAFGAAVVAPSPGVVRRFDKAVHDDVSWQDEMEGRQR